MALAEEHKGMTEDVLAGESARSAASSDFLEIAEKAGIDVTNERKRGLAKPASRDSAAKRLPVESPMHRQLNRAVAEASNAAIPSNAASSSSTPRMGDPIPFGELFAADSAGVVQKWIDESGENNRTNRKLTRCLAAFEDFQRQNISSEEQANLSALDNEEVPVQFRRSRKQWDELSRFQEQQPAVVSMVETYGNGLLSSKPSVLLTVGKFLSQATEDQRSDFREAFACLQQAYTIAKPRSHYSRDYCGFLGRRSKPLFSSTMISTGMMSPHPRSASAPPGAQRPASPKTPQSAKRCSSLGMTTTYRQVFRPHSVAGTGDRHAAVPPRRHLESAAAAAFSMVSSSRRMESTSHAHHSPDVFARSKSAVSSPSHASAVGSNGHSPAASRSRSFHNLTTASLGRVTPAALPGCDERPDESNKSEWSVRENPKRSASALSSRSRTTYRDAFDRSSPSPSPSASATQPLRRAYQSTYGSPFGNYGTQFIGTPESVYRSEFRSPSSLSETQQTSGVVRRDRLRELIDSAAGPASPRSAAKAPQTPQRAGHGDKQRRLLMVTSPVGAVAGR